MTVGTQLIAMCIGIVHSICFVSRCLYLSYFVKHHREKKRLKNLARRHSVAVLFLPLYSPNLNPIEKTWANMKRALPDILSQQLSLDNPIYHYLT
jgi:transposase